MAGSTFLTLWRAQLCPRLAPHRLVYLGFAHLAVISMVVSFFWLRLPSVCSVASYIQYFNHWHNLSKYCLFQRLFQFAFSKTLVDTCFGLNLNRGLNKTNVLRPNPLLHKELFYTKTVLSTNTMLYTKTMLLLGLCKGCLQLTGEFFPWWPAEHAEGS